MLKPTQSSVLLTVMLLIFTSNQVKASNLLQELKRKQHSEGLAIAMVWDGKIDIVLFDSKIGDEKKLNTTLYFLGGKFAPNGEQFAGDTDHGLTAMDLDGKILLKLNQIQSATDIDWSPDGTKIAFQGKDTASGFDGVQVVVVSSKEMYQVARQGKSPSWSADGSKLVYSENGKILIYDFTSKSSVSLGNGTDSSWSPNGKWITYRSKDNKFYLTDTSGKVIKKLFGGNKVLTSLHWSPDSQYVMFINKGPKNFFGHLSFNCLEAKQIIVYRLSDGKKESVGEVCKSSPIAFVWVESKKLLPSKEHEGF